eukprot:2310050-Rhodomonas_salina.4
MHIQCECSKYEENWTAAHHAIAKATLAGLKDLRLPGWRFWYETPFKDLPFEFKWSAEDLAGKVKQPDRQSQYFTMTAVTGGVTGRLLL